MTVFLIFMGLFFAVQCFNLVLTVKRYRALGRALERHKT